MSSITGSLVEPYPQVVAGTPESWGFTRSTKTFRLTYATAMASGRGRFPAGAITEIAVPGLVYRHGYSVQAAGAAIISRGRTGVLEVASCRRAKMIRVTVSPAGPSHGSCVIAHQAAARRAGFTG